MEGIDAGRGERARVTMRWVPGYKGNTGNERAGEEAKKAARGDSTHETDVPVICPGTVPISKAAELQRHHKALKIQARTTFKKTPRARQSLKFDPTMPSPNLSKLCAKLARRPASLLVQLRTRHIPLNKHLFKIGKADSPICTICHSSDETVHHFLLQCPAYMTQRKHLEGKLKRGARSLRTLAESHDSVISVHQRYRETRTAVRRCMPTTRQ